MMFLDIFEQSLLFLPLALGIYFSFAVLKIPDLTSDGSFVMGASLSALCIHLGVNPFLSLGVALLGGSLTGLMAAILQSRFRLHPLIVGILLVFVINTAALLLMGKPNLSLFDRPTIFSHGKIFPLALIGASLLGLLFLLLNSRAGLMFYAFGNSENLLRLSGKNAHLYRFFGLSLSNGLAGLCGSLTAQASGYADINMGTGIVLIALGTVMIGLRCFQFLFKVPHKFASLFFCLLGTFLYFALVHVLISFGLNPIYLRLCIGVCLIAILAAAYKKGSSEIFA